MTKTRLTFILGTLLCAAQVLVLSCSLALLVLVLGSCALECAYRDQHSCQRQ